MRIYKMRVAIEIDDMLRHPLCENLCFPEES